MAPYPARRPSLPADSASLAPLACTYSCPPTRIDDEEAAEYYEYVKFAFAAYHN